MSEVTTTNSWSDEQIKNVIEKSANPVVDKVSSKTYRSLMVIGCGDGGCNIASEIRSKVPNTFCILYNTSQRAINKLTADVQVIPTNEDGTGKNRKYSQDVFKNGAYKYLLENVTNQLERKPVDYILIVTTCDGGTGGGVSPMVAKFIADNVDCPVIILGVYPSLNEDAASMFNAMTWQQDVDKTGLPHILLSNDTTTTDFKVTVHRQVNEYAVKVAELIAGTHFGETNISAIDNKDMNILLNHIGGRISLYGKEGRPTVNQSIDDYVTEMTNEWKMLKPANVRGIGLFVKSTKDIIERADTALNKFRATYGNAAVQYVHLEECDNTDPGYIALICSGCDSPMDAIMMMKNRYDDIQASIHKSSMSVNDVLGDMDSPLGTVRKEKPNKRTELDLSALEF